MAGEKKPDGGGVKSGDKGGGKKPPRDMGNVEQRGASKATEPKPEKRPEK